MSETPARYHIPGVAPDHDHAAPLTLATLQREQAEWARRNFPGTHEAVWPLIGVGEEYGELCHANLKMHQGIRGTREEHMAAARDAVGDIMIYLADYCTRAGIDMQQAIEDAWGEVKRRDWKKNRKDGRIDG